MSRQRLLRPVRRRFLRAFAKIVIYAAAAVSMVARWAGSAATAIIAPNIRC
jgi:hypothetical protein